MRKVYKEFDEIQKPIIKDINVRAVAITVSVVFSLLYLIYSMFITKGGSSQANIEFKHGKETDYFIVRYTEQDVQSIDEMIAGLEGAYIKILDDLQSEHKNKIVVNIYSSKKDFDIGLNMQGINVSNATAIFNRGKLNIISLNSPDIKVDINLFKAAASHELTRYTISGILNSTDITWLSECIAMYEVRQNFDLKDVVLKADGSYPTIQELKEGKSEDVYDISFTLTEFIIEKWGREQLVELLAFNGDIEGVLGVSEMDFEKEWHQFIDREYLK